MSRRQSGPEKHSQAHKRNISRRSFLTQPSHLFLPSPRTLRTSLHSSAVDVVVKFASTGNTTFFVAFIFCCICCVRCSVFTRSTTSIDIYWYTGSAPMPFAVSAKNIFSDDGRYTQMSSQNASYNQQIQDPRFASVAPW